MLPLHNMFFAVSVRHMATVFEIDLTEMQKYFSKKKHGREIDEFE